MSNKQSKHTPYLRLFTRDIEGSPKINSLSMAASGLYFRLLNRLNEPPMPGSIALHDWEQHYTWQRSWTQQCLSCTDKEDALQYFAKLLKRHFQWKEAEILKALKELYFFGIITIEEDRLIQPRMYRDNGYLLASDPVDEEYLDRATGAVMNMQESVEKSSHKEEKKKKKKNDEISHARVHAPHALSIESENNNINSKDKKGGVGENTAAAVLSGSPVESSGDYSFAQFWEDYDKQVSESQCEALWNTITPADREAIRSYIPKYKVAQPNKRFRKNPVTFLRERAWEDEIISETAVRKTKKQTSATVLHTEASEYENIESW